MEREAEREFKIDLSDGPFHLEIVRKILSSRRDPSDIETPAGEDQHLRTEAKGAVGNSPDTEFRGQLIGSCERTLEEVAKAGAQLEGEPDSRCGAPY
jgi:hypothetical protein